jgi:hypothetical protein
MDGHKVKDKKLINGTNHGILGCRLENPIDRDRATKSVETKY